VSSRKTHFHKPNTRRLPTTTGDLRPPPRVMHTQFAPTHVEPTHVEPRRAPLIELFGHSIDVEKLKHRIIERVKKESWRFGDAIAVSIVLNLGVIAFKHFTGGAAWNPETALLYSTFGITAGYIWRGVKSFYHHVRHQGADEEGFMTDPSGGGATSAP
jgi:hypothetical protein